MKNVKEIVLKKEAVTRLLDSAIDLYFEGKDLLVVTLIVKSVYQVISDLMKKKYGESYYGYARISLNVRDDYQKQVFDSLREDVNFLKHADRKDCGLNSELVFNHSSCETFLALAIPEYSDLFGDTTDNQKKFLIYYGITNLDAVKEPTKSQFRTLSLLYPYLLEKKNWMSFPPESFHCFESPKYW